MSGARTRVSVLLPVWNAEARLEAALRSVARQSQADFECVVVDDGSRDASASIAERFVRRDGRFRVLRQPHGGVVRALMRGAAACRGEIVARMDADDVMHRHRLARQLAALDADPRLAAVGCHVRIFPRATLREGMRRYERWLNAIASPEAVRAEAFVECPIAHPTLLIRRDVLLRFGYRDAGWPEDYDLLLRLLEAGCEVGVVARRLLAWRDEPSRLSRRSPAYGLDRFTACKARFMARGLLAPVREYVLWGYGGTGRALRRALLVEGRRPSHVVELHPGRLGNRIHGAPVVPPSALPGLRPRPIVVSVAGAEPRRQIRAALAAMGFRESVDFVCAA